MSNQNELLNSGESASFRDQFRKMAAALAVRRIALWEYDIQADRYDFDEGYFEVLGLDRAGIHFTTTSELMTFIHADDVVDFQRNVKLVMKGEITKIRFRCIGRDGSVVWLEDDIIACHRDETGQPVWLCACATNVTAECERDTQILRLEERNRKVVEALPEFIFIFDERFFLHDVLMSQDRVLLHALNDLIGHDAHEFYSPEVSDLFVRNIRQCLADNTIREIEYPLDKDGARYYFQARIAPFDQGRVMALIHDIGDRVEWSKELIDAKKKAEEADRMKSVFLATMSHEIRTPLNAIVGFSELLASCDEVEEREDFVGIIRSNSDLLLQLINDILDLSRIESGRSEMHFEPVEVMGLMDEVSKVHCIKMHPNVRFEAENPEGKIWLTTDRNRLTQILFNFLSNAIKNTQEGVITLGVRLHNDRMLDFFVRDTGRGIPKDKLEAIFNAFEKLDDFVQGTGLGLSICQSIADRIGGRIEVCSELGVGSEFSLRLAYNYYSKEGDSCECVSKVGSSGARKVILVAEAVEFNFKLLSAMIGKEYTLRWVNNGEEVINSFMRERPDLILMSMKLPGISGLEAAERIRTVSSDIPIVAVLPSLVYATEQLALSAGCNVVVSKPYSRPDLQRVFDELL